LQPSALPGERRYLDPLAPTESLPGWISPSLHGPPVGKPWRRNHHHHRRGVGDGDGPVSKAKLLPAVTCATTGGRLSTGPLVSMQPLMGRSARENRISLAFASAANATGQEVADAPLSGTPSPLFILYFFKDRGKSW
jgi:hypothetical protein